MKLKEKLLIYLSRKNCVTLEEVVKDLGIKTGTAKVYLSRLARDHVITRRWLKDYEGKKVRLYCLNSSLVKELHA